MTRVCLLGSDDVALRQTLLSHETAREALRTYDLTEPFHNAIGLETVSLGAAVALLNDLNWYLVRYAEAALVREPSVSESEWLSRDLATAIRDDRVSPAESGRYLKVYGVQSAGDSSGEEPADGLSDGPGPGSSDENDGIPSDENGHGSPDERMDKSEDEDGRTHGHRGAPPKLVEPMYVTRSGGSIPEYDLRDVGETVVVRVTEAAFGR
ncbi:DUF5804 family protein [Halorhabdus amylolytica]|uniref:DUF5804 family protein n=1 Tax=Halorhabdus amylolytica TaxID=2559573 RepID=UPI0010AB43C3|nr:DUF5804 family protein [Halorhabdus amylolytica]